MKDIITEVAGRGGGVSNLRGDAVLSRRVRSLAGGTILSRGCCL